MEDQGPRPTSELAPRSIKPLSQPSPLPPSPSKELADHFSGWQTIGGQRGFYDERDCLDPSRSLVSEKLQNRKEDEVVIFDYSLDPDYLNPRDCDYPIEEDGPSLGNFSANDDIFFQVPKSSLMESRQVDQVINMTECLSMLSLGPRLRVM